MRIILCFNELQLGVLTFENNIYRYTSNQSEETLFKEYANSKFYKLFSSVDREGKTLFEPFATIVKDIRQRPDLLELCSLASNSSDFEVLCEYAKTNQFDQGYHLIYKD